MSKEFPNWYRAWVVCRKLAVSFDHYLRTKATHQQARGLDRLAGVISWQTTKEHENSRRQRIERLKNIGKLGK